MPPSTLDGVTIGSLLAIVVILFLSTYPKKCGETDILSEDEKISCERSLIKIGYKVVLAIFFAVILYYLSYDGEE